MAIKVTLLGVGRMGVVACEKICETDGLELVSILDVVRVGETVCGLVVQDAGNLAEVLSESKPDVVIDFTLPDACVTNSRIVADAGIQMIVGPTGLSESQRKKLEGNLESVGAVIAPNMSVGVNVFFKLVGEAADLLSDYDIEVVEAHHKYKKDAPSGTALRAAEIAANASGRKIQDFKFGRKGASERREGEIGIHSIRAGDITGEHTVSFTTLGERFELRHIAHSRGSFATGIPQAIQYLQGKTGIHDMQEVLGL